MKTLKLKLFTLAACALALAGYSQTSTDTAAGTAGNTEIKSAVISFAQNVESNRTITASAYPMYAPDIVVNGKPDNFGGGVALLCPADAVPALAGTTVGQHAFAGLRFDYLAHQAFASTIGVGVKGDVQLWGHNVTAFAHAGANIPFSGFGQHNGELGGMAGAGVYTELWHPRDNITLGIQLSGEKWTQFPGMVYLGGPVLRVSF